MPDISNGYGIITSNCSDKDNGNDNDDRNSCL